MIHIPTPDPKKPKVNWVSYYPVIEMKDPVMTANCPLCNSVIPSDHPALQLTALSDWVASKGGWSVFENDRTYPVGQTFTIGSDTTARVVAKKVTYNTGDIADAYYDGELPQGSTFEAYAVIQIGNGYFKKTGTGDSYGDISWDGDLKSVKLTEKIVQVFE